jgi:molybdopterin converting factor small subunit
VTIVVTCLGHIRTSLGREEVELTGPEMTASELIERIRSLASGDGPIGFSRYNTLLVVNGEAAFTASSNDRLIMDGDRVLLVPFSHGG